MGLFLFTSCETTAPCECGNTSNGFVFPGQSVNMGSESTVDVFKKIDAAWLVRDYETMKAHIADDGNYRFYDGTVATNGEEFVAKVEQSYQEDLANGVDGNGTQIMLLQFILQKLKTIIGMKKVNG